MLRASFVTHPHRSRVRADRLALVMHASRAVARTYGQA